MWKKKYKIPQKGRTWWHRNYTCTSKGGGNLEWGRWGTARSPGCQTAESWQCHSLQDSWTPPGTSPEQLPEQQLSQTQLWGQHLHTEMLSGLVLGAFCLIFSFSLCCLPGSHWSCTLIFGVISKAPSALPHRSLPGRIFTLACAPQNLSCSWTQWAKKSIWVP